MPFVIFEAEYQHWTPAATTVYPKGFGGDVPAEIVKDAIEKGALRDLPEYQAPDRPLSGEFPIPVPVAQAAPSIASDNQDAKASGLTEVVEASLVADKPKKKRRQRKVKANAETGTPGTPVTLEG